MAEEDNAGDVLSRAEVAIRRARGLTRMYSNLLEPPCTLEVGTDPETQGRSLPEQEGLSHVPLQLQVASPGPVYNESTSIVEPQAVDAAAGPSSPGGNASTPPSAVPDRPYLRYFQTRGGSGYLPPRTDTPAEIFEHARPGNRDTFSYYLGLIRERNRLVSQGQSLLQGSRTEASASELPAEAPPSFAQGSHEQNQAGPSNAVGNLNQQQPQTSCLTEEGSREAAAPDTVSTEDLIASCPGAEPVLVVAQRLANLQQQQAETMRQLLRLRLEQLRYVA